jgi:glycosyltransferase involved in cell wall biosynthesis
MSATARRILFVSHSASLNGASVLLLHTLHWMKHNTNYELHLLCLDRGPLVNAFREVAHTHLIRNPARTLRGLFPRGSDAICAAVEKAASHWLLQRYRFDLVYANTAAAWQQVAVAKSRDVPVLWHIHELPYALRLSMGDARARQMLPQATRLVAVSASVAEALNSVYVVPTERIDLVHGFVADDLLSDQERKAARTRVLASLGWPEDAFVVGGCGGLGWRKGSDLFVQIAAHCRVATDRPMRFLWVGGSASGSEAHQFAHDIERLGLQPLCRHVPSTPDVLDYYHAMDVFALSSREDPFPLVMLEAGIRGVPTVCFAGAGGGGEFVAERVGIAAPYLDVAAFAQALLQLTNDPAHLHRLAQAAQLRVRLGHTAERQLPKLMASIENCIESPRPDRFLMTKAVARRV